MAVSDGHASLNERDWPGTGLLIQALRRIATRGALQDVLEAVALEAKDLLQADGSCVLLQDSGTLSAKACVGCRAEEMQMLASAGGFAKRALTEARALAVPDALGNSRYAAVCAEQRSALCVPITGDSGPMGVLLLTSRQAGHFRPQDTRSLGFAQVLADYGGCAIQLAQRRRQVREALELLLRAHSCLTIVTTADFSARFVHRAKAGLNRIASHARTIDDLVRREKRLSGREEVLDTIKQIAEDLGRVADSVRMLGRGPLWPGTEKRQVCVNELVRGTVAALEGVIWSCGCSYGLDLTSALDSADGGVGRRPVVLREHEIQYAIVGLTLNALHASDRGQRIEYGTRWHENLKMAEIWVQHCGASMDAEAARTLFKPSLSTDPGCLDGALYAVDVLICEGHGGEFRVESRPGGATICSILVPAPASSPESPAPGHE